MNNKYLLGGSTQDILSISAMLLVQFQSIDYKNLFLATVDILIFLYLLAQIMLCELETYVHENLLFVNLDDYFEMSDADIAHNCLFLLQRMLGCLASSSWAAAVYIVMFSGDLKSIPGWKLCFQKLFVRKLRCPCGRAAG